MRQAHWVKPNHQERMPPRMVAFDTESLSEADNGVEVQEWRVGCAIRWRTDLKTGDHAEGKVFDDPESFWRWVAEFCHKGQRTVVWAHNLGYDVRISRMFDILPRLGFRLEWCNLDRNISSATWRSDNGTIVLADTWTWIPLPLNVIAPQVGLVKYDIPRSSAQDAEWAAYCMRDTEILYHVVSALVEFIRKEKLGNWQPTGAGMAYSTWRHRFLEDKVLVHDDVPALEAERMAMHTGRAEAWRHGELIGDKWTEVDLKNAYLRIAASTEVPRKLHMHHRKISVLQYRRLHDRFAVLARVKVRTERPCVPYRHGGRCVWPVGTFETWLWDCEIDQALDAGAELEFLECYTYVRAPVLAAWAKWVMGVLAGGDDGISSVARTHVKHCSRALIGRIGMRVSSWEPYGDNIEGYTGITHVTLVDENRDARMLHVGPDTLIETARLEGKDSLPMITGYIMAKCRVAIWNAIQAAGEENVGHVDTDSVLVNSSGLLRLARAYGDGFLDQWSLKGTYTRLTIFGPRCYYRDKERKTSGIPLKAQEVSPGEFTAERWSALATDLEAGTAGSVTIRAATYTLKKSDPRRTDDGAGEGRTRAYRVEELD